MYTIEARITEFTGYKSKWFKWGKNYKSIRRVMQAIKYFREREVGAITFSQMGNQEKIFIHWEYRIAHTVA